MRKWRHREVESLVRGHTVSMCQSLDLMSGSELWLTSVDSLFILLRLLLHISPVCPFSIFSKASTLPCGCCISKALPVAGAKLSKSKPWPPLRSPVLLSNLFFDWRNLSSGAFPWSWAQFPEVPAVSNLHVVEGSPAVLWHWTSEWREHRGKPEESCLEAMPKQSDQVPGLSEVPIYPTVRTTFWLLLQCIHMCGLHFMQARICHMGRIFVASIWLGTLRLHSQWEPILNQDFEWKHNSANNWRLGYTQKSL